MTSKSIQRSLILTSARFVGMERYWRSRLAGDLAKTSLYLGPPDGGSGGLGAEIQLAFPAGIREALLARSQGDLEALYSWCLAAIFAVLHRYTQDERVTVASPINRLRAGPGTLNDRLYLTLPIGDTMTLGDLVQASASCLREAYENQDFPLDEILRSLPAQAAVEDDPLTGVDFVVAELHGHPDRPPAPRHLRFFFRITGEPCATLEGDSGSFDNVFLRRLGRHFLRFLEFCLERPDAPVATVDYLSAAETHELIEEPGTDADYPRERTVPEMFEEQVERHPESIAAVDSRRSLTYAALNARANQLARALIDRNVGRNQLVGVAIPRSVDRLACVLGILKAGAGYVPLDPHWPRKRLEYSLRTAQASVVVCGALERDAVDGLADVIEVDAGAGFTGDDRNPPLVNAAGDHLYCLFTSGSTGKPKGVLVPHRAFLNRVSWLSRRYEIGKADVALQKTAFTFDVSVCELLRAPVTGGKVCFLAPGAELDQPAILRTVHDHGVTAFDVVPSMLRPLLQHVERGNLGDLATVRWYFIGAEALPPELVRQFNDTLHRAHGSRLINLWGATETTIDVTWHDCTSFGNELGRVPIGRPMQNVRIVILDRRGTLQPTRVPGEICVGGDCLAEGYLAQPELTAAKFVCPSLPGIVRLYRTGDLGRRLEDGSFDLLGRIDGQVKIRGAAVEPAEIEAALRTDPAVDQALVALAPPPDLRAPRQDANGGAPQGLKCAGGGEGVLIAYLVLHRTPPFDLRRCREHLRERLPAHMMPACFVSLPALPRAASGKIDRGALPVPDPSNTLLEPVQSPRTEIESKLVKMWERLLHRHPVGISDSFFDLGGSSLKATELLYAIASELEVNVDLATIFARPTIAQLAEHIVKSERTRFAPIPALAPQEHYALSSGQMRIWIADAFKQKHTSYVVSGAYLVDGDIQVEALERTLASLVRRHEVLRTSFHIVGGKPVQRVGDWSQPRFPVAVVELDETADYDDCLERLLQRELETKLELDSAPLLRVTLVRRAHGGDLLVFVTHHIIVDEWSMRILLRELLTLYEAHAAGRPDPLAPLRIQYKEFAAWHNALQAGAGVARQRDYWLRRLAGLPPVVRLPGRARLPGERTFRVDSVMSEVDPDTTASLKALAAGEGVTMFILTLAVFKLLLHRVTGADDIVVGTTVAGRRHVDLRDVVGFIINTLPLRTRIREGATFRGFLAEVKSCCVEAFDAQDYPFESLIDDLGVVAAGSNPLFDIVFEYNTYEQPRVYTSPISLRPYDAAYRWLMFDYLVTLHERSGRLAVNMCYSCDLYDRAAIERLAEYYGRAMRACAGNPDVAIAEVDLMTARDESAAIRALRRRKGIQPPSAQATVPQSLEADFDFPGGS